MSELLLAGGYLDITPEAPMHLAGYGLRRNKSNAIGHGLEVNALLLQCGGNRVLIVQIDVISVGMELRQIILRRLGDKIRDVDLFLVASHTHFAPNIDPRLWMLGPIDPVYAALVADKTVSLLDRLLTSKPKTVHSLYGEATADHAINRRRKCIRPVWAIPPLKRQIGLLPNPRGPKDETVRTVVFSSDREGRYPEAVAWNYTCHPVSTPSMTMLSADYPGAARKRLREAWGNDLPVIFLPGFSGNIRPRIVSGLPLRPYNFLKRVANGPIFGSFTPEGYLHWSGSLADKVRDTATSSLRPMEVDSIICRRVSHSLAKYMTNVADDRQMSFHQVQLGRQLLVLGISAEPVVEYSSAIRALAPDKTVICTGYIDGVCSYLPTSEILVEGGLEATSPGYDLRDAVFRPDISQRIVDTAAALLKERIS